jgi:hypothetical protein
MPKTQFIDEALRFTKTASKELIITRSDELDEDVM